MLFVAASRLFLSMPSKWLFLIRSRIIWKRLLHGSDLTTAGSFSLRTRTKCRILTIPLPLSSPCIGSRHPPLATRDLRLSHSRGVCVLSALHFKCDPDHPVVRRPSIEARRQPSCSWVLDSQQQLQWIMSASSRSIYRVVSSPIEPFWLRSSGGRMRTCHSRCASALFQTSKFL
jgi:hypothetical protein